MEIKTNLKAKFAENKDEDVMKTMKKVVRKYRNMLIDEANAIEGEKSDRVNFLINLLMNLSGECFQKIAENERPIFKICHELFVEMLLQHRKTVLPKLDNNLKFEDFKKAVKHLFDIDPDKIKEHDEEHSCEDCEDKI